MLKYFFPLSFYLKTTISLQTSGAFFRLHTSPSSHLQKNPCERSILVLRTYRLYSIIVQKWIQTVSRRARSEFILIQNGRHLGSSIMHESEDLFPVYSLHWKVQTAKMAEYVGHDLLSSLSSEVLSIILAYLPAKSLLNLSETCRRLRDMCVNCDTFWKRLCKVQV